MQDAFGLVAIVALMPLIIIQIIGAIYKYKSSIIAVAETTPSYGDEIIVFKRKIVKIESES